MVPCLLMLSPQTDYIPGFQKAVSNVYTHSRMCTHRQCSLPQTILANAISASLQRLIHPTFALRQRKKNKMHLQKKRDVFILSTTLGQEATVRTGTIDWFQIRKGVCQGCLLSPCLFNLYAESIMRNAGLNEHKLESRLPGEITSDMQMTPPLWQKMKKN